ncbi:hypothetical protein WSM22_22500 [Cytophagales bacterium WSM2-2]|nr:hypothetical protein WSM22_22500 [Cytophagales bacterium WSM2-2]
MQSFKILFIVTIIFSGCQKENTTVPPRLIFKFKFDNTQARLNNFGQPATMPSGHAGQSPRFNKMSAHYIELTPTATTALGSGTILYKNEETSSGGNTAIDFEKSILVGEGEEFFSIPLSQVKAGTYPYLRVSLAYQNYDIDLLAQGLTLTGTLASFIGYNTYVKNFTVKNQQVTVNANKLQGYWAFETSFGVTQGQAPAGATTVPNPLISSSPIPAGSCVVTGQFASSLTITGKEAKDVVIIVSLSTNKSFEWIEVNADGKFEPLAGENVVDMGIRGLIPIIQ